MAGCCGKKTGMASRIGAGVALLISLVAAIQLGCRKGKPGEHSASRAVNTVSNPSAPELMRPFSPGLEPWRLKEVAQELRSRVQVEKERSELHVPYYRIGIPLAYPLPLQRSPKMQDLPVGIQGITYPWYTWLSWSLEERWRLLHVAWRRFDDHQAGELLQRELAALDSWDQYCETVGGFSLSTAHIAACLSQALEQAEGWDKEKYQRAHRAAEKLFNLEAWPWFQKEYGTDRQLTVADLQNVRMIGLARTAQLARVLNNPNEQKIHARAVEALRLWFRVRTSAACYTEGTTYDGYFLDSCTEWLAGANDRDELLKGGAAAMESVSKSWQYLLLPGRPDAQAPLGDVEPEMPFWTTAWLRLALWQKTLDADWFLRRLPLQVAPAAFLVEALDHAHAFQDQTPVPSPEPAELPHAAVLRTGWDRSDILAAIGLARNGTGHLHNDAGQLVLGWQSRFWITDPGYQQYRPGSELVFSMGPEAHNAPVIAGIFQTQRAPRLIALSRAADGSQRTMIDLTACYEGLPRDARVVREVRLLPNAGPAVLVRDLISNLHQPVEVQTCWQGGTDLAWAFRQGWARLSDGHRALWIGVYPGSLSAADLDRHEGSWGPLTFKHRVVLAEGEGERVWLFVCDEQAGWAPLAEKWLSLVQSGKSG